MSNSDWEEVKRLAADFQRAQLTSANQRLTERNCVEIVTKLIELKLLDVVFTTDGKGYVTPDQLNREIQDELYVHGGRLSLTELSSILNVGINVVEQRVQDVLRGEKDIFNVLGQLITSRYVDNLCEELNEKLKQDGSISISELSKTWDLPGEFLQQQVEKRLGRIVFGTQDEQDSTMIYTETFVKRNTCKVRGILSAITKPTPFGSIVNKFSGRVPERLFFAIVTKLIKSKRIDGTVSGSGNRSSYFIPSSYSRAQTQWIDGFMKGNGYVDLDAASRLGISEPRAYVEKNYPGSVFLKSYCVGELIFKQAKESVDEALETVGWVDVTTTLPISVSDADVKILLEKILPPGSDTMVFDSLVVNRSFVRNMKNMFKPMMEEKAVKDIQGGNYVQMVSEAKALEKKQRIAEMNAEDDGRHSKKDDRRKKAAGGKAGGGAQGRETKTKSTKKKYLAGKNRDDSDSEEEVRTTKASSKPEAATPGKVKTMPFLAEKEVQKHIKGASGMNEAPEELTQNIASYLLRSLTEEYQQVLKEAYDRFMAEKCGRKSKEEIHQKVLNMISLFQFYSEGIAAFDAEIKSQLEKFLLRTYGQETAMAATAYALVESGQDEAGQIEDLPNGEVKDALLALGKASSADAFLEQLQIVVPPKKNASMKSTPSLLLMEARDSLHQQLEAAENTDPALYLHLATLLLFSYTTGTLLQASGKFVPQIISCLEFKLTKEEYTELREYQEAVVQFLKSKGKSGKDGLAEMYTNLKSTLRKREKQGTA